MPVVPLPTTPTPYDTGWAWIEETRDLLTGPVKPQVNLLEGVLDETTTTLTVQYEVNQPTVGSVLSIGLETMLVWDYQPTSRTVTVQRGYGGTTAEAHAGGELVYVDPRFTSARIWRALRNECVGLSSEGLWRADTIERVFDVNLGGVDLSSVMLSDEVLNVSVLAVGDDGEWRSVPKDWYVQTNLDSTYYSSGRALFFVSGGPGTQDTVRITYKAALDPLADPQENPVEATGIPPTAADIPPIGAAVRLMASEPVPRADPTSSPTSRRPGETSVSDLVNAGNALRALRGQRLGQEIARLASMYPTRLVTRGI